ncbi:hypothetical protein C8R45DRAFT_853120 [Mycena sanguinolenta]|nr:hypothetical protein C8R45DRAFT_853120 [Mycena sanguinolenta]
MNVDSQPSAEELRKQKAKLRKLGRVVRELLGDHPADTQRALESCGIEDLDAFLSSSEDSDVEAFWDEDDRVYRCPECKWELQHGECVMCGLEFEMDLKDDADYTVNESFNLDRLPQPRGDTPLRDDEQQSLLPPPAYVNRQMEYEALRQRGATRLMCETFNLEFDEATGIVAWADGDIYYEFSGPLMQKGDFWKIMLGRRIQLDEDDPDGSLLLEGLLEDAMVFQSTLSQEWETVEESPGLWVTRPVIEDSGSDSGSELDIEEEADKKLEPGYVAPALPVQAHGYETSDAESDDDMAVDIKREEEDEELGAEEAAEEDGDPGWTCEANVPDSAWSSGVVPRKTNEEMEGDAEDDDEETMDSADEDSADSDFDSDEVLSGDEGILLAARQQFTIRMIN